MSIVGDNIKRLRLERGMTQEELARLAGFKSRSSINKIELGERDLNQSRLAALARALSVSPGSLLDTPREVTVRADTERIVNNPYYVDPDVAALADELKSNPDMQVLLDASRNLSKEDMQAVATLIKSLSQKGGEPS